MNLLQTGLIQETCHTTFCSVLPFYVTCAETFCEYCTDCYTNLLCKGDKVYLQFNFAYLGSGWNDNLVAQILVDNVVVAEDVNEFTSGYLAGVATFENGSLVPYANLVIDTTLPFFDDVDCFCVQIKNISELGEETIINTFQGCQMCYRILPIECEISTFELESTHATSDCGNIWYGLPDLAIGNLTEDVLTGFSNRIRLKGNVELTSINPEFNVRGNKKTLARQVYNYSTYMSAIPKCLALRIGNLFSSKDITVTPYLENSIEVETASQISKDNTKNLNWLPSFTFTKISCETSNC